MDEISEGEAPRLTAKSILPINSVICYVHFLKKNFIEIDELEFRRGFKSIQKVLLKADAVCTVPITAKTLSKVQRENKHHPPSLGAFLSGRIVTPDRSGTNSIG